MRNNTPENKTILVDMDGVMVNFDGGALVALSADQIVERTQFYVAHDYPEHLQSLIKEAYTAPGFFENLAPMPGVIEGWQAMIDAGYHPRVASAPLPSNPTSVEGKIKWLDKHMVPEFGPRVVEEAIIDKDKWKYSGLAIIDDRPNIPRGPDGEDRADWEHILFGWAHRADMPLAGTTLRLLSWQEPDYLIGLLKRIETSEEL